MTWRKINTPGRTVTADSSQIPISKDSFETVWRIESLSDAGMLDITRRGSKWTYEIVDWNEETQDWEGTPTTPRKARRLGFTVPRALYE